MATINIFGSIDVEGLLEDKQAGGKKIKEKIISHYGFDPTVAPITDKDQIKNLQDKAKCPLKFGYTGYKQIPDFVRLVSAKTSSEGYKITPQDIKNGRVTSLYELQINAHVGDTLRWWGHTINPMMKTQCIISQIARIRKKGGSTSDITQPQINTNDVSFYYASRAAGTEPDNGVRVETSSAYTVQLDIPSDWDKKIISYDIEVLLLSGHVYSSDKGLVSYPIAKLVVDPTINLG